MNMDTKLLAIEIGFHDSTQKRSSYNGTMQLENFKLLNIIYKYIIHVHINVLGDFEILFKPKYVRVVCVKISTFMFSNDSFHDTNLSKLRVSKWSTCPEKITVDLHLQIYCYRENNLSVLYCFNILSIIHFDFCKSNSIIAIQFHMADH